MKIAVLIIGFSYFSVVNAGVGILSPPEEADAWELFAKFCGSGSEGGDWGGARVWCKFGPGENLEVINHNVEAPAAVIPDSVVFVQPPPVTYKHNIAVQGGTGIAPRTKIYVLPQKSSHSITSEYNPGAVVTSKPNVFFLRSNGDEGYRYGTPAPPGIAGYEEPALIK
ncbi:uncharacterized protein LOC110857658 [Folsomia candida]|uniref:Uncharacterized protein n=1 Tax=Folsomia candida TaxID=158441 RepID=A0A226DJG1_FOLCA|nr:uncharacterized protein LOC110857658 [Folsomia candida]OXA44326.1 hypothetical protein Fcan01_20732 [Folsomia candida]